LQDVEAVEKLY